MHALLLAAALSQLIADAQAQPSFCWAIEDDEPSKVVCEAVEQQPAAGVVRSVAKRLAVSDEAAALIVETQLRLDAIRNRRENELSPDERASLEQRLRAALDARGRNLPLLITLAQVLAARDDFVGQILPLLRSEANAPAAIVRVATTAGYAQDLYAAALEIYRNDPELLQGMSQAHPFGAAFGPALIGARGLALRPTYRTLSADALATYADHQIDALLLAGRGNEALALFDLLPKAAQSRLLRLPGDDGYSDTRLGLAAAAALAGDESRARAVLKFATPARDDDRDFEAGLKILEASLQPRLTGDVFDVVVAAAQGRVAGTMSRLYAALLERGGYSSLAAEVLRDQARIAGYLEALEVTDTDAVALAAAIAADAQSLRARARMLEPATPEGAPLRQLLEAPRLTYFRELPMPADIPISSAIVLDPGEAPLAGFVRPLRKEQSGSEIMVLGTSQIIDPVGEVASGAYWLLRSRDGGATWSAQYTGLRSGMPYVAVQHSHLPLVDGDHVHIEVEVKEIDLDSITFPPIALQTKREQSGLYVDFAWDDLTRDSDNDGVTDLVEERLVLDPNDADTDDDGIPDGIDTLPFVTHAGTLTPMSNILGAVYGDAAEAGEPRTHFLIAARAMFAPLALPVRTIVLTPDEHELYEKKFGPLYGTTIRTFAIDRSGKRAIIELNDSWKGETLLMRREDERWERAEMLSSWIS
jgi:hypothetical protein